MCWGGRKKPINSSSASSGRARPAVVKGFRRLSLSQGRCFFLPPSFAAVSDLLCYVLVLTVVAIYYEYYKPVSGIQRLSLSLSLSLPIPNKIETDSSLLLLLVGLSSRAFYHAAGERGAARESRPGARKYTPTTQHRSTIQYSAIRQ